MSFFHLSLFLAVSYSIIDSACSPNIVSVSLVTLSFFSSFISLSYLGEYTMVLIVIVTVTVISNSSLLVLITFFSHFSFHWNFICFQFNPWCLICVYKVFRFGPSTFNFLIFLICSYSYSKNHGSNTKYMFCFSKK